MNGHTGKWSNRDGIGGEVDMAERARQKEPKCPQCKVRPVAYVGAIYCGAACCQSVEMHMPPAPDKES